MNLDEEEEEEEIMKSLDEDELALIQHLEDDAFHVVDDDQEEVEEEDIEPFAIVAGGGEGEEEVLPFFEPRVRTYGTPFRDLNFDRHGEDDEEYEEEEEEEEEEDEESDSSGGVVAISQVDLVQESVTFVACGNVEMSGWQLQDDSGKNCFSFSKGFFMEAGSSVTLWCTPGGLDPRTVRALETESEDEPQHRHIMWKNRNGSLRKKHVLNDDGDTVRLVDADGEVVASLSVDEEGGCFAADFGGADEDSGIEALDGERYLYERDARGAVGVAVKVLSWLRLCLVVGSVHYLMMTTAEDEGQSRVRFLVGYSSALACDVAVRYFCGLCGFAKPTALPGNGGLTDRLAGSVLLRALVVATATTPWTNLNEVLEWVWMFDATACVLQLLCRAVTKNTTAGNPLAFEEWCSTLERFPALTTVISVGNEVAILAAFIFLSFSGDGSIVGSSSIWRPVLALAFGGAPFAVARTLANVAQLSSLVSSTVSTKHEFWIAQSLAILRNGLSALRGLLVGREAYKLALTELKHLPGSFAVSLSFLTTAEPFSRMNLIDLGAAPAQGLGGLLLVHAGLTSIAGAASDLHSLQYWVAAFALVDPTLSADVETSRWALQLCRTRVGTDFRACTTRIVVGSLKVLIGVGFLALSLVTLKQASIATLMASLGGMLAALAPILFIGTRATFSDFFDALRADQLAYRLLTSDVKQDPSLMDSCNQRTLLEWFAPDRKRVWQLPSYLPTVENATAEVHQLEEEHGALMALVGGGKSPRWDTANDDESEQEHQGLAEMCHDVQARASTNLANACVDALVVFLNYVAFVSYALAVVIYYQPGSLQSVREMAGLPWPGDEWMTWALNLTGDCAWTLEPLLIISTPLIVGKLAAKLSGASPKSKSD